MFAKSERVPLDIRKVISKPALMLKSDEDPQAKRVRSPAKVLHKEPIKWVLPAKVLKSD